MKHWMIRTAMVLLAVFSVAPVHADDLEITRWDDGLEWFLEAEHLAAGEARTFLVHLTLLEDHTPVSEGRATLELRNQDDEVIVSGSAEADRPGIFPIGLDLPAAGEYALVGRLELDGGERTADLGRLEVPDPHEHSHAHENEATHAHEDDHEQGHEHHEGIWSRIRHWFDHDHSHDNGHEDHDAHDDHHDHQEEDGISFLKETQWRMNFAVVTARSEPFAERVEVPGSIREIPGARARLVTPADGVITAIEHWPKLGQSIDRREPLMRLTLLPDSAAASGLTLDIARAGERLAAAEADLERLTALADEGVIADSRVVEARRERNTARAELADASERQARLGGDADADSIILRAPANGRLEQLAVSPGEVVQAGQHLATVLDGSRQWLVAQLYPADFARVTELGDALVRVPGNRDWRTLEGPPVWESGEFGGSPGLLQVAFALPGDEAGYRPGLPVTVALAVGPPKQRILLPRQALIDDDGIPVVMIQTGGESFERRPVRTGLYAAGQVEIVAGLEAGERVVTEGAYAVLLAGRDTDDIGHGHSH